MSDHETFERLKDQLLEPQFFVIQSVFEDLASIEETGISLESDGHELWLPYASTPGPEKGLRLLQTHELKLPVVHR